MNVQSAHVIVAVVMNPDTPATMLDLDLNSPLLSERDAELLRALLDKRMIYAGQGRGREAHGVSAAVLIVWQAVTQPDIAIDLPDTAHLDL
jgi:hypothetical protein